MNLELHHKITATHLQRQAYLYVRQSTLRQVLENTESTKRQYALRERAVALGWPLDRVVVIDSDLGQSGADSDRLGFQKLVAAVGLGEVGVVLGLEVSRLARSSSAWHRSLEICALTDTLLLDEDGLYNPGHFNDRLLLRLKRTMSEAERHVQLPRGRWRTLIRDARPGYLSWDEYEENLRQLHDNAQAYGADRRHGPPREGPALLQGLAVCGRCGGRMTVRYYVSHHAVLPEYTCQRDGSEHARPICQRIVGGALDRAIGELLVEIVSPLALEVALAVQDELEARTQEVDRMRRQQVERARYEAELAQRRYLRVDPDNRLVADSLEAEWNTKLRALSAAQEEYERQRTAAGGALSADQRRPVMTLVTDFP